MAEKKEYRSAVRSRRLICQAFQELLKEKSFEKITVTDIVNRADINRSTFYAHYSDVRGLVETLLDDVVNRSLRMMQELDMTRIFSDPEPLLRGLLEIGMENMELYRLMGQSEFALMQVERLKTAFLERVLTSEHLPEQFRSSNAFQIQINFFIGGILNTYQQWLLGNLVCTPEEIMEQIGNLIVSNQDTYMGWMKNQ